jgi:hypothetical protein
MDLEKSILIMEIFMKESINWIRCMEVVGIFIKMVEITLDNFLMALLVVKGLDNLPMELYIRVNF